VLIDLLWPEADLEEGRGSLRVQLHTLRERQALAELYLGALRQLAATRHLERGDLGAARPLLKERLALCRTLGDPGLLVHALGG
jgi:hypothetical protein